MRHLTTACALALSGCALASATPPSIDVLDVRLVAIGLNEQQLAVTLCVYNPNPSELAFRRVTANLDVAGNPLAVGASDLAVRLPPTASTTVPFTVVTTIRNLGPQLASVFRSGSLDYRVHGTVSLEGALGLTLPYSRSGRLDAQTGADLATAPSDRPRTGCRPA